ncbi:MAG: SDR family NAD(P)-dependent oxidoreductase [Bacteroidota bacterium]|nr:SDR family NAD(P)-dependent oxidoreductase [Bacteroidota bacterium]MDP4211999.1 SDR family NAD(P)-dependent oxidoreductase [Bacteroidota bacterium]MDP4249935.1 SDR family NAD(P)-dependent oxidoreductase [Bacteroidota bacterium]
MPEKFFTLITGASEGLGKSFALDCARRNMHLILVALPDSGLDRLVDFIRRNFPVSVIAFEKDLTGPLSCHELLMEIQRQKLSLRVLINNAGIGSTLPLSEESVEFYERQIRLNVLATTIITRLFLTNLEQHTPSYILNVGSMASFFFLQQKQVYGATKSYIYFFSKSLRKEVRRGGIHVAVLCPGGINTNVPVTLLNRKLGWFSKLSVMEPERVAAIAMDRLLRGDAVIVPGMVNNFFMLLDKLLPGFVKKRVTDYGIRRLKREEHHTRWMQRGFPSPSVMTKMA